MTNRNGWTIESMDGDAENDNNDELCCSCGTELTTLSDLSEHQEECGLFTGAFECLVCARRYHNASSMIRHANLKHKNMRSCTVYAHNPRSRLMYGDRICPLKEIEKASVRRYLAKRQIMALSENASEMVQRIGCKLAISMQAKNLYTTLREWCQAYCVAAGIDGAERDDLLQEYGLHGVYSSHHLMA